MDWSKAKRILIVAFLIVNIILITNFIHRSKGIEEYITTEGDVKKELQKVSVEVDTKIPTDIPDMGLLEVKYQEYDNDSEKLDMAEKFLSINGIIDVSDVEVEDNTIVFREGNEALKIIDEKELIYIDKNRNSSSDVDYDPHEVVEEFLKDKEFSTEDYVLKDMKESGTSHILTYLKKYKDTTVEKTYMKFVIDSSRVVRFERLWIDIIEEKKNSIKISPASDSLLKLLSNDDVAGKTIKDIKPCYYFEPTDTDVFNFEEIRSGDAIPAWKIVFTDNTNKFIYDN